MHTLSFAMCLNDGFILGWGLVSSPYCLLQFKLHCELVHLELICPAKGEDYTQLHKHGRLKLENSRKQRRVARSGLWLTDPLWRWHHHVHSPLLRNSTRRQVQLHWLLLFERVLNGFRRHSECVKHTKHCRLQFQWDSRKFYCDVWEKPHLKWHNLRLHYVGRIVTRWNMGCWSVGHCWSNFDSRHIQC